MNSLIKHLNETGKQGSIIMMSADDMWNVIERISNQIANKAENDAAIGIMEAMSIVGVKSRATWAKMEREGKIKRLENMGSLVRYSRAAIVKIANGGF